MSTGIKQRLVLAVLAFTPFASQAGFRVVEQPSASSAAAGTVVPSPAGSEFGYSRGRPVLREYGAPGVRETRHGFGKDLPLSLVATQIAPRGWSVEVAESAQPGKLVSWNGGGKPWTVALSEMATASGVYADLDWDRSKVTITAPSSTPVKATLTATSAAKPPSASTSTVVQVAPAPAVMRPQPAPKVWVARKGPSLRAVAEEWALSEQWTLVWDSGVDYPVSGLMSFKGNLTEATTQLFEVYAASKRPPKVEIFLLQKLIHVTE